jgi:hypothetical protein
MKIKLLSNKNTYSVSIKNVVFYEKINITKRLVIHLANTYNPLEINFTSDDFEVIERLEKAMDEHLEKEEAF